MVFLDELATNATARNVSIIVYSGNNDLIISHRGSEGALAHPLNNFGSHDSRLLPVAIQVTVSFSTLGPRN